MVRCERQLVVGLLHEQVRTDLRHVSASYQSSTKRRSHIIMEPTARAYRDGSIWHLPVPPHVYVYASDSRQPDLSKIITTSFEYQRKKN